MFYIKLFSDVLKDTSLNLLEKVVKCQLIEIWENQGYITEHNDKKTGLIKLSINRASKELNISRASYYRCIDRLENLDQIVLTAYKGEITVIKLRFKYIENYFFMLETDKIISELREKWKKN